MGCIFLGNFRTVPKTTPENEDTIPDINMDGNLKNKKNKNKNRRKGHSAKSIERKKQKWEMMQLPEWDPAKMGDIDDIMMGKRKNEDEENNSLEPNRKRRNKLT